MVKRPEHLVFGLDIGTRNLVGTVGFRENEHLFRVVAISVKEHETRAMLDGQIHDIAKVAESIGKMKKDLEEQVGSPLESVCIAAAGRVLKTVNVTARVEFTEETHVKNEHIHALDMLGVEQAYEKIRENKSNEKINYYCVGYSVVHYYLNDYPMTKLEDHKANNIGAELIATFLPEEVIDGLYSSVESAGLQVENLTLEPIAAMEVAIPEKYRLLNIALVDVGAGTSDICITKDGSVIAYGMIPHAGDELTEELARKYLVEFNVAEKIKQDAMKKKTVSFKDIMGLKQKVASSEILETVDSVIKMIAGEVSDKIKELNGGKSVSAVFVVGGGGKIKGFTEQLAESLGLAKERVALRGEEVLNEVEFLQEGVKKDPLLVTPIGICYSYYEARNNFIFVNVNGERVKLYDNNKLTVVDAAMQMGFPNEDLFPKRGASLHYKFNGETRVLRGESGEAAVIKKNGKNASISSPIEKNDQIEIIKSTAGNPAEATIGMLPETHENFSFTFDGKTVECPKFPMVNGETVTDAYKIKDGDEITLTDYYTLEQVLSFMDLPYKTGIEVNHLPAPKDEKIYANFTVYYDLSLDKERKAAEDNADETPDENIEDTDSKNTEGVTDEAKESAPKTKSKEKPADIFITVNGDAVKMSGKSSYILVDVLDFYPFDMSKMGGDELEIRVNDIKQSGFTAGVKDGDRVTLTWINR
ncbi:MAG: pilus assembly protein PilM [Lachnospiraceae bacterium]|nr:pilus assembly protein PilM [Lachnospiraceae bacterium]